MFTSLLRVRGETPCLPPYYGWEEELNVYLLIKGEGRNTMFTSLLSVRGGTPCLRLNLLCSSKLFFANLSSCANIWKKNLNFKFSVLHFGPNMNRFPECILEAIKTYKTDFYLIWFGFFVLIGAWIWTRVGLKIINYQKTVEQFF